MRTLQDVQQEKIEPLAGVRIMMRTLQDVQQEKIEPLAGVRIMMRTLQDVQQEKIEPLAGVRIMMRTLQDVQQEKIEPLAGVRIMMRTLQDVQQQVDTLIREEWHSTYWAPLSSLARLTEEVGELAREINAVYGEKPKKAGERPENIASEMGDVLFILASLANSIGINLDEAFGTVMAKYQYRDAQRWKPRDEHS
jgi:NTP pyrophosphatase (non-canonical NTP hydrolase)